MKSIRKYIDALFSLLFPRSCIVCNNSLVQQEEFICSTCNSRLPRTNLHLISDNEIEKRFWGKVEIQKATSYFYYTKGSDYRKILYQLKYRNCKELGEVMGRYLGRELLSSDFFDTIDIIIPVPLHPKRKKSRGYNQSEWLAKGISNATGIPLNSTLLIRTSNNKTQTRKSVFERWINVQDIFKVTDPEKLEHKHILLVDDVLTTGATLQSCAITLSASKDIKISILTLAIA